MKKSEIYKEDGKLKINFIIDADLSMFEFETQLEDLIGSMKEKLSEMEILQVKHQVLLAYNNAIKNK